MFQLYREDREIQTIPCLMSKFVLFLWKNQRLINGLNDYKYFMSPTQVSVRQCSLEFITARSRPLFESWVQDPL